MAEQGDGRPEQKYMPFQCQCDGDQDSEQIDGCEDTEVLGAIGGGGDNDTVDYGRKKPFTEAEMRTISQTQILLSRFLIDNAQRDMPRERYDILFGILQEETTGYQSDDTTDINLLSQAVLSMGDELYYTFKENRQLNNWIESVPADSVETVFSKVCTEMFADKQMNFGRIIVLFYLAYRLISKFFTASQDWASRVKTILKIALDFFCKFYVHWLVMEGGWKTILNHVRNCNTKTAVILTTLAIGTFLYYFYSD